MTEQVNKRTSWLIAVLEILVCVVFGLMLGVVIGYKMGYTDGTQHTTEIRNQLLNLKPYDASLTVKDLEYSDYSPSGVTITFNTDVKTYGEIDPEKLVVQWTIYPSDIFTETDVWIKMTGDYLYVAAIETYPEGGTLMFRILDKEKDNKGSLWFYVDLPRPNDTILPPPYKR